MRVLRPGLLAIACTALTGFAMPPDSLQPSMPPNTILFSQMMRELSEKPGFTKAFVTELQLAAHKKSGTALLTPDLVNHLRELILGKDWDGLDRFPGWHMSEITPTIGEISRLATDKGSPEYKDSMTKFLDVGPYRFDSGESIDMRKPSPFKPFTADSVVTSLGNGVLRGDGPNEFAPEHADSQRLAYALNRLSANGLDGVQPVKAFWNDERSPQTPEDLIDALLQTGQTIVVTDSRYFANFGHLHYNGADVMTPFFVNSQIEIPGAGRALLVPGAHAEYEWHIRGPLLNADVAFYFGIDGKAQFRTMDELDQPWVMHRDAHEYRQTDAVEITRLAGAMVRTYMRLHQAHTAMPFGGYFAFGVCQDVVAAIELKMTGNATLFPNTADDRFFSGPQADPRDAEINALIVRLPKDRDGKPPDIERVFASLPVGVTDAELAKVSIPGLGADLIAVRHAWLAGNVRRTESLLKHRLKLAAVGIAALLVLVFTMRSIRRSRAPRKRAA